MTTRVSGRAVTALRRLWSARILEAWAKGAPVECTAPVCVMPSRAIGPASTWDLGHAIAIADGGAVWDPSTITPQHSRCNRREGQQIATRRRTQRRVRRWV